MTGARVPESRRAAQNATWFAVSTGRPRSSSSAWITPMARNPLPPMKTASALSGVWRANPLVELAGMDGALVGRQLGRAAVDHLEPLPRKYARALLVQLGREPGRMDQRETLHAECGQRRGPLPRR